MSDKPENKPPAIRTPRGTFAPGVSGNPTGRPKMANKVRDMAKAYTEQATIALAEALMAVRIVGMASVEVPDHQVRIAAAQALLDRAWGRPCSVVEMPREDDDGNPLAGLSDSDLLKAAIDAANELTESN